jgi:hypothetical protein
MKLCTLLVMALLMSLFAAANATSPGQGKGENQVSPGFEK